MNLDELIVKKAEELGLDKIGFASVPWSWQKEKYEQYLAAGYSCGFEQNDTDKRYDVEHILPQTKTIIGAVMAYPPIVADCGKYEARFCAASIGNDYHRILQEKLRELGEYLKELVPESNYQVLVDTGDLSDREIAILCGLGWIGKNSNLITEEYGSFVYLGEILWDHSLEIAAAEKPERCSSCQKCVQACPVGAIDPQKRMVDTRKCLAYKTLDKNYPSEETVQMIAQNGYIYGCDCCQLACPYNAKVSNDWHEQWQDQGLAACDVLELLGLSNREFKEKYGHISGSWRGKNVLIRNGIWILGARRLPELKEFWRLLAERIDTDDLRRAVQWAYEQYDGE